MFEWYIKDGCMEVNINKTAQLFFVVSLLL